MGRLFSPNSGLMKGLSMVGDLVLLNFLFLLCCLPVLTVGASLTALNTVTLQIAGHREGGVVKPFFRAFKKSFLNATAIWIVLLAAGYLVALGIRVINANPESLPWLFNVVYAVVGLLLLVVADWAFVLEAQFENIILRTLKNALILGLTHPLVTLVTLVLSLTPVALALFATYWFLQFSVVWFLFGFSGTALINALMFSKVFKPFMTVQTDSSNKEG